MAVVREAAMALIADMEGTATAEPKTAPAAAASSAAAAHDQDRDGDRDEDRDSGRAVGGVHHAETETKESSAAAGAMGVVQLHHVQAAVASAVKTKRITPGMLAFYRGFRGRG